MLEDFAQMDHSNYCISLLYIDRPRKNDGMNGENGATYAMPNKPLEGACARFRVSKPGEPKRSRNVAYVNFQDFFGLRVDPNLVTGTVLHEASHMFGAPVDQLILPTSLHTSLQPIAARQSRHRVREREVAHVSQQ